MPSRERPVGWRGDLSGVFIGATPPVIWDYNTKKNIRWEVPMPKWADGGCIVVGKRIITLATPHTVLCYDADTGKRLWYNAYDIFDHHHQGDKKAANEERQLWSAVERGYGIGKNSYGRDAEWLKRGGTPEQQELVKEKQGCIAKAQAAGVPMTKEGLPDPRADCWTERGLIVNPHNSSMARAQTIPVSDGTYVWVAWGTNSVSCYDLASGALKWFAWNGPMRKPSEYRHTIRNSPAQQFTPSPFIVDGKLLVMQDFMFRAFDPDSGTRIWETDVDWKVEGHSSGGTFVACRIGDTWVIITPHGWIYGMDGRRIGDTGFNMDSTNRTPVIDDATDTLVMADGTYIQAFQLSLDGGRVICRQLWKVEEPGQGFRFATSNAHDGKYYHTRKHGVMAYDLATGTILGQGSAKGFCNTYQSTFLTATGLMNLDGEQIVVPLDAAGLPLKVVGGASMWKKEEVGSPVEQWRAQAFAEGAIGWIDVAPTDKGWVNTLYGGGPFFQGGRVYLRSRAKRYCIEATGAAP